MRMEAKALLRQVKFGACKLVPNVGGLRLIIGTPRVHAKLLGASP
jgi:hypothetical protein